MVAIRPGIYSRSGPIYIRPVPHLLSVNPLISQNILLLEVTMASASSFRALPAAIACAPENSHKAEQCLSKFASLNGEERKEALPSTIELIFPLVFGKDASVENSAAYDEL